MGSIPSVYVTLSAQQSLLHITLPTGSLIPTGDDLVEGSDHHRPLFTSRGAYALSIFRCSTTPYAWSHKYEWAARRDQAQTSSSVLQRARDNARHMVQGTWYKCGK